MCRRRRDRPRSSPQAESADPATGADFRIGGERAFYDPTARLRAGSTAAGLFRADQLAPDRLA